MKRLKKLSIVFLKGNFALCIYYIVNTNKILMFFYSIYSKSKFFTHALRFLKSDPDNIKKVALLLYIEAVAKWLNMPIKDAKKRGINICPYSEEVNSYIIETYSIQSYSGR